MPMSAIQKNMLSPRTILSTISVGVMSFGMMLALLTNVANAQAMLLGDEAAGEKRAQEKCVSCHIARFGGNGNEMYTRDDRRVKTVEGLMQQVQFCNANTGAGFDEAQQDDIIAYLNGNFYHYGDE